MSASHKHHAKKRFGQNFLHDTAVILDICSAINATTEQHLVEIGPGLGALTRYLADQSGKLDLIELDRDLIQGLEKNFSRAQIKIHQADALTFNFATLAGENEKLRIVGNLPYNISTPLIFHLLAHQQLIEDMHFMLQKEVVDRLCASPGTKQYGRLSIMVGYCCECTSLFDVLPESFDPVPKVTSAVVRIKPCAPKWPVSNYRTLENIVSQAFNQRRKTLRNSLKTFLSADDMITLGIEPGARAETLSLESWSKMANHIANSESQSSH